MNGPTTFRTPYERRVELVKQTLITSAIFDDDSAGTSAIFDDDSAGKLAVQVLRALDSIPEKIR
ncbi:hypothetical protein CEG92_00560 [Mycobacterium avium subsp. paratuberculosis]|uniref:DUF6307 family protein n=1 Tax=Mycobacterium avium TaxID=1764 RepID=UPI000B539670|nr:DUF6307 family protein [Mycobacterium avium]ASF94436.1 hypothetical protein CEG92_00560 [Mycobacterium avium subsp. paratuberculosis]